MIEVTPSICLDESELHFDFVQSSGPGGQNINKVASGVQLRFNIKNSQSLPENVCIRLKALAGKRITAEGTLVIEARRYRTQDRNKQDAINRLVVLIRKASEKPKVRKKTNPTLASRRRRLEDKKHRSEIKRLRRDRDI